MEVKVLGNALVSISKSLHKPRWENEKFGFVDLHSYFTLEELESLWAILPHLLDEVRDKKKAISSAKKQELKDALAALEASERAPEVRNG